MASARYVNAAVTTFSKALKVALCIASVPVSYTHLDVYKRQILSFPYISRIDPERINT